MSQESFTSVSNERNCTSEHICSNNFHSVFLLYYYFAYACPHFKICAFKCWEHVVNCHINCYTGRIFLWLNLCGAGLRRNFPDIRTLFLSLQREVIIKYHM